MKDIILVGGFHEMVELCEDTGLNIIGIIDNKLEGDFYGYPIIGRDEDAHSLYEKYSYCSLVITPDSPAIRKKLVNFYRSIGFSFATVIHPSVTISRTAIIGEGTVLQQGVNVSANTVIGRYCKLNTNSNVMHDNAIADYSTIAPNAVLLGYVSVGGLCYIGANSTILPHCTIGEKSVVGAGAVVTKEVQANSIVAGVPAKRIKG